MADVYGIELMNVEELDPGFTPVEAMVVLKGVGSDGEIGLLFVHSPGLTPWEMMGIGEVIKSDARAEMTFAAYEDDDDD